MPYFAITWMALKPWLQCTHCICPIEICSSVAGFSYPGPICQASQVEPLPQVSALDPKTSIRDKKLSWRTTTNQRWQIMGLGYCRYWGTHSLPSLLSLHTAFQHHVLGCLKSTVPFALQLLKHMASSYTVWLLLRTIIYG